MTDDLTIKPVAMQPVPGLDNFMTNPNFLPVFEQSDSTKLIMWPHVNVNTLVKQ